MTLQRIMRILRYAVMFFSVCWAGAAAALEMWFAMVFWLAFLLFIYFTGRYADKQIDPPSE